jgi:hypothetical protein
MLRTLFENGPPAYDVSGSATRFQAACLLLALRTNIMYGIGRDAPQHNVAFRRDRRRRGGILKLLVVFVVGLALSIAATGITIQISSARPDNRVFDACVPGEPEIDATDLPEVVQSGRCPFEGRRIVDGAVKSVVPPPGKGVFAEVLTTTGAQELGVVRSADGTLKLDHVGDDSEAGVAKPRAVREPGECTDTGYKDKSWWVPSGLHYRFNVSTTPRELRRVQAVRALRRAGANVVNTRNSCHLGDQVPAGLVYDGNTSGVANIEDGSCVKSDGESVVSFGDLPKALALTCTYYKLNASGYDEVGTSDVKINRADFKWTTRPGARSCKRGWDLQSVLTHERGHTFGLGHVSEQYHGRMTMSPVINGPCQKSERTLGKGDVLGLEGKYP